MRLRPDKIRVLRLQPVAAFPAPIEAALSLRHDALKAELAGLGEHDRAFGGERLAEQDAFDAGDEQQERASPPLERTRRTFLPSRRRRSKATSEKPDIQPETLPESNVTGEAIGN